MWYRLLVPFKPGKKVVWATIAKPGATLRESLFRPVELIDGGFQENESSQTFQLDEECEILAPVERPPCVWAVGLNYQKHADETGMPAPKYPTLFMKSSSTINGPFDPVITPEVCNDEMDYEGELAIIIGKECKNASLENAMDYVLGMCVANDVSARKWQGKKGGGQWCRSKSFDTFLPLGPCLVPHSKLQGFGQNLTIKTVLHRAATGESLTVQNSSTSDMIFSIPEIISFVSSDTTLLPWTVIITGTPEGVGFTRKPPLYLQPKDEVEVSIDGIGTIKNLIK